MKAMAMKAGSRVQVAVRLRPVLKAEEDDGKEPCVRGISDKALEIWNWRDVEQSLRFEFDAYLDSFAPQRAVYKRCMEPLLSHVLAGQNASVFAYGPTGTGKTYTMLGTDDNPGVIPRSLNHLFEVIDQQRGQSPSNPWSYAVSFSYLEIYQEKIYDLLKLKNQDLPIREDRQRNIFIPNLAERTVTNFSEFAKYFIPASKNRTTAATKLNSRSSRSHSILLLKVVKERTEGSQRHTQTGKLYLIDLAGSENNKKTGNQGIRLKESGAINTSLFVLGQVVDALTHRLPRVPYRDSKLTRLLQDSLGGSAHACMIASIAPEETSYMDTYTTLHFAAKSKQIVNRPRTRETRERVGSSSGKRALEEEEGGGGAARKAQAVERNGRPAAAERERDTVLQPLLEQQAHFEVSVEQKLQSLEVNLLKQISRAKTQPQTPTSKKLLSEVKSMRRELSSMQQKRTETVLPPAGSSGLPDRRSTFTLNDPRRPSPPSAVVRPFADVSNQSPSYASRETAKSDIRQTSQKRWKKSTASHQSKSVKFVKSVNASRAVLSPEAQENQWQLRLDPDFQAKHRAEILRTLNEGSVRQLKSLQSVGEKRAQLIHNWRQAVGAFTEVEDLYKVAGLPSKTVTSILGNNLLCTSATKT